MASEIKVFYFTASVIVICIVIMILILCLLIYKLYCIKANWKKLRINSYMKVTNIGCVILFILVSMLDLYHLIRSEISDELISRHFEIVRISSDALYFASSLLLYIILVTKLYMVFSDTTYSISKYFIAIFCILMILFLIAAFMFDYELIEIENKPFDSRKDTDELTDQRVPEIVVLICVDICLNCIVSWLFIAKLRQVVLNISMEQLNGKEIMNEFQERRERVNIRSNSLQQALETALLGDQDDQDRKQKLLVVITRLTLLRYVFVSKFELNHFVITIILLCIISSVFQCICNQLFYLLLIWTSLLDDPRYIATFHGEGNLNMWYSINYGVRSIELALNSIIVCCSFEMNHNIYQCLCGCCDKICYRLCVKKTIHRVIDEIDESIQYD